MVGLDGCEVRLCDPCALVLPRGPCVPSFPLPPPGVFLPGFLPYTGSVSRVSRVCPGSPRCLFTGSFVPDDSQTQERAAAARWTSSSSAPWLV